MADGSARELVNRAELRVIAQSRRAAESVAEHGDGQDLEAQGHTGRRGSHGEPEPYNGCCTPCISDWPKRSVQRCCPSMLRLLTLTGHEHALEVRDKTHFSLYLCAAVSLVCLLIWTSDVVSGGCALPRPWLGREGLPHLTCIYEAAGVIIFFGTLVDCVQMLGNYDNEHRDLLERKKKLMADLFTEVMEALERAKENAKSLFDMLYRIQKDKVSNHVKGYFDNVLPLLYRQLVEGEHGEHQKQHNMQRLSRLTELLGGSLNEPHLIVATHCKRLIKVNWVADDDKQGKRFSHQGESETKKAVEDIERFSQTAVGDVPVFWKYWLKKRSRLGMDMECEVDESKGKEMLDNPGDFFFEPSRRMGQLIDALSQSQRVRMNQAEAFGEDEGMKPWVGCGRPDWSEDGASRCCVKCCLPRLVARTCQVLTCCCCCIARCCVCKTALEHPKRFQLGCFWVEIISRLHERLINSIILSSLYCLVYVLQDVSIFTNGCGNLMSSEFWSCAWEIVRQNALLFGLLWNIPAMFTCLRRVQHLDLVFTIMEDIRKLQNIRSVVKDLDRTVKADIDKKEVDDAIKERVLVYIPLIESFRVFIVKYVKTADHNSGLLEAVEGLVEHLEATLKKLGSPAEWGLLPEEKKKEIKINMQKGAEKLQRRQFKRTRRTTDGDSESTGSFFVSDSPSSGVDVPPSRHAPVLKQMSLSSEPGIVVRSTQSQHSLQSAATEDGARHRAGTPPMRVARRGCIPASSGSAVDTAGGTARKPFLDADDRPAH